MAKKEIIIQRVSAEENQGLPTRKKLYTNIENKLGRPLLSFFTSFRFPVMIEDVDAEMLSNVLSQIDLAKGLVLLISSPGGSGLAAERIIEICRNYSKTSEYCVIVPGKAKSAATMICFGASNILMGPTSELGPVDPQCAIDKKPFSVYNIVRSYETLFERAVKTKGNLEPFLQQLRNYDEREIQEFRASLELSADISVRTLASGMMKGIAEQEIRKKIKVFLTPEFKKTHGRPIYAKEAVECGLSIEMINTDSELWKNIYELYIRLDRLVNVHVSKCVESKEHSFSAPIPKVEV